MLLLSFIISSCKVDPCDKLVYGVYVYPKVPDNHNWTQDQVAEYVNIPKDVLECITTSGLIESTMNYPLLGLILAGANPQSGYDNLLKVKFRGLIELENRADAAKCFQEKYSSMEPSELNPNWTPLEKGTFINNFFFYEVIYSQFVILEKVEVEDKKLLINEVIEKFYKKTGVCCENDWDLYTAMMGLIISARLMYIDNYSEFMNFYNSSIGISEFTIFISPTFSFDEGFQLLEITQNYFNQL